MKQFSLRYRRRYTSLLAGTRLKTLSRSVVIIAALCVCAIGQDGASAPAVPAEKRGPITIPKFDTSPVIDGRLDDEIWKRAAVLKDFFQIQPGDNITPSKETIAYVGFDQRFLYVGFHAFEDPALIRATVAKRDDVFADDHVRITLDTFNDQRRAYFLYFNPLGIQADGILTDNQFGGPAPGSSSGPGGDGLFGSPDLSVDIVMESKGVLLDDGYSVEVKIPFKSLRYAAGKGQLWGFNVGRRIPRLNNENDSWMPMARNISSLRQIGKITGLEGIRNDRSLEIVPSVTLSESGERIADGTHPLGSRLLNRPIKRDIGVSLKYQITPNVTLDAAVNPDFAEVEADAPVVSANERFPIFFPEKRPFFLEGIDYFRTSLQVVNTRTIADPDVAVKLTGKVGRNTFGLLSAVDRFPNTSTRAYVGVLRLKRDLGVQSYIGLIGTTYHFGARQHNTLGGFDGKYQLDPATYIDFQLVGTTSRRPFYDPDTNTRPYRTGNGFAYQTNYDYTGKTRGYRIGVSGRSRDYRADVGFTRRTNTHGVSGGFRLGTEPNPQKTLINMSTRTGGSFNVDEDGRLQTAGLNISTEWNFQDQFHISSNTGLTVEKIYEDEFGARRNSHQQGIFYGTDFREARQFTSRIDAEKTFNKRISLDAGVGFATNIFDLDFGAGKKYPRVSPAALLGISKLDPGPSFNLFYDIGTNLRPTDPWSISFSYRRQRLTRNDTHLTALDSNIYSLRSTYQFTRSTFARVRMDYQALDGSVDSQLLFGWNPNPGTAVYVGYNDSSFYRGFNDFNDRFDDGLRRDGRRFFIRMSYLFRKSL